MDKSKLKFRINREIESLPSIGKNLRKLKNLVENPYSDIREISSLIRLDIAMAAEMLKVANSAKYMQRSRIDTLEGAIKLIGLKETKVVIMAFEAKRAMEDQYPGMDAIWEHSSKVGFFAQQLKKILISKRDWDDVYLAGLLHDIGKVILIALDPQLMKRIVSLSEAKQVPVTVVEKMIFGMTHSDIGSIISNKWNYPQNVSQCIKYHHEPAMANEDYKEYVYPVYLANEIANMEEGKNIKFENLDKKALAYFNVNNEEQFEKIKNTLIMLYEELSL